MAPGMMMGVDPNDPNAQQSSPADPTAQPDATQGEPVAGDPTQDQGLTAGQDQAQDQPGLDTAATAGQPQVGGGNPDDVTFVTMVAGLRKHIFGAGEAGIVKLLLATAPPDLGRALGEVVFALVREAAKQAVQANREVGLDILMGVATEVIDDIVELMAAHGLQISDNDKQFALLYAQHLYTSSSDVTPDDRNAAKQQLAMQRQDGSFDTAVSYVQQKGMEAGVDPFGVNQLPQRPGMMGKG